MICIVKTEEPWIVRQCTVDLRWESRKDFSQEVDFKQKCARANAN
jgi:hypothetical protein